MAQSIYGVGNIGLVSLLGAVTIPMFNALAAILLETGRHGTASPKKLLLAIAKNPTVIATALGLAVNFSGLEIPGLVLGVVKDIAGLTTPLSFLSIGVSLSLGAVAKWRYLASILSLRLLLVPLVFVTGAVALGFRGQELCALLILFAAPTAVSSYPMAVAMDADGDFAALVFVTGAVALGFRGQELCALLILFAAPTAVSSYPMAVAMDADGDFAAQSVAYSTLLCLVTIFLWTLALNGMGML